MGLNLALLVMTGQIENAIGNNEDSSISHGNYLILHINMPSLTCWVYFLHFFCTIKEL